MSATKRKPLQYSEALRILSNLPEEDRSYILAFLLAVEKRDEHRAKSMADQLEEHRKTYREQLRAAIQKLHATHQGSYSHLYERVIQLLSRRSIRGIEPETQVALHATLTELRAVLRVASGASPS